MGVVGDFVTKHVLQILNEQAEIESWKDTLVTLIPKIASPKLVKDYMPISLCNVAYKIVAHVITNRLRVVMDEIIDQQQSVFVPRRLITYNVLVGFECRGEQSINW